MPTPGNVDGREPLKDTTFTRKLFGKLLADRGYISQNLFEELFVDDIHLVTRIKKNMKKPLMSLHDKILLRKRLIKWSMNCIVMSQCNQSCKLRTLLIQVTDLRQQGGGLFFCCSELAKLILYENLYFSLDRSFRYNNHLQSGAKALL